ncbi:MAG: hypothetical protein C0403_20140, partial [Desulfobacterium sp.]|nr:hypothetical protein [Desulfobacterium sp.]
LEGLREKLEMNITERLDRLKEFSVKVTQSDPEDVRSKELSREWPEIESLIRKNKSTSESQKTLSEFKEIIRKGIQKIGLEYIRVIQDLSPHEAAVGSRWLQHTIDEILLKVFDRLPSFGFSTKMEQGT